jgi:hypothetical protein
VTGALTANNEPCSSVNHVSITWNLTLAVIRPKRKSDGKPSAVTYREDLTSWCGGVLVHTVTRTFVYSILTHNLKYS